MKAVGVVLLSLFVLSALSASVKFSSNIKISKKDTIDDFTSWYVENLDPQTLPFALRELLQDDQHRNLGVFATRDLKQGQDLVKVPFNMMLTAERILEASLIGEMLEREDEHGLSQREVLTLYLAFSQACKPEMNPWQDYLQLLPKNGVLNAALISQDDLLLLNGSHWFSEFRHFQEKSANAFSKSSELIKKHRSDFPQLCPISKQVWDWALSIVISREFELLDDEGNKFLAVIPFLDFIKPSADQQPCFGYKKENRFFHLQACGDYKTGDEVAINILAGLSNGELFRNYGLVLPENPNNFVLLPNKYLGVHPQDPNVDLKVKLLEPYFQKEMNLFDGRLSPDLLGAAKIIVAEPSDFREDGTVGVLSDFATLKLCEWFQVVCRFHLAQYATDIQADVEFVNSPEFATWSEHKRALFTIAFEEKKIIYSVGSHFGQQFQQLKAKLDQQQHPGEKTPYTQDEL